MTPGYDDFFERATGHSPYPWWLSRLGVRYGWRWLQPRLNRPWNTPSVDWKLRGEHNAEMAAWAAKFGCVLIAGHTHKPVFFEGQKEAESPKDIDDSEVGADEHEALSLARAEWAAAEEVRLEYQAPKKPLETPCYFNTGCCSYGDGDITGLETRDGMIWLVRWPCEPETEPEELECMALQDLPG